MGVPKMCDEANYADEMVVAAVQYVCAMQKTTGQKPAYSSVSAPHVGVYKDFCSMLFQD
jgi:hypothetical protein